MNIKIPPEVVEHFLLRIESLRSGPLTETGAEFVLRDVLSAWPGMEERHWPEWHKEPPIIILPLTQEARDDRR